MVAAAQWFIVTLGWVGGIVMLILAVMFLQDIFQKKHSVRRNFPIIGRLRYFLERQGEFFRQYFFSPATGRSCLSTAPHAAGFTASPRVRATPSVSVPPTINVNRAPSSSSTPLTRYRKRSANPRRRW